MRRYGYHAEAELVARSVIEAGMRFGDHRLPELYCGFQRQRGRGPTLYPVACSPQAWASATPFTLLEASLGLEFDPGKGEIRLRNPRLPSFVDEVTLRNLRLDPASVDLRVRRHKDAVSLDILRTHGKIQVSIICSPRESS